MQIWTNLVLVVQVVAAITMIGLVLVQHGKGADMGASFGSGASGSLFGATGSANFLSRFTAVCAAIFFVSTLSLAYFSNSFASREPSSGGSVLDRAAVPASGASSVGGAIPVGSPSALPAPVATPAATASAAGTIPTK